MTEETAQPEELLPILAKTQQVAAKSSVLQPFVWLIGVLLAGGTSLTLANAPPWALVVCFGFAGLTLAVTLGIAIVLIKRAHYAPMLSERYNLGLNERADELAGKARTDLEATLPHRPSDPCPPECTCPRAVRKATMERLFTGRVH